MLTIPNNHLNILPPVARQFVNELRDTYSDLHARSQASAERLGAITDAIALLEPVEIAGNASPDQLHQLAHLRADREATAARNASAAAAFKGTAGTLTRIAGFLSQAAGDFLDAPQAGRFVDVALPLPSAKQTLDSVRERIAQLTRERAAVAVAPPTAEEIAARIKAQVASLAARGAPPLGRDGTLGSNASTTLALLAWYDADALTARLVADATARGTGDLPAAARLAKLTDLDAAILAAERVEESIVRDTGAVRRAQASPLAVLSIAEAAYVAA